MSQTQLVRWAILGCGRVAERRVAPAFAACEGADLVAFCSRDRDRARAYAAMFGVPGAYDSLDGLLADPAIDCVYVATPNRFHAEQAVAILSAGKHVLVDKPMATRAADARVMVETARRSGRTLAVLHQQRFHAANREVAGLLHAGSLGRLNVLRVQLGIWFPPGDNWRLDPGLSGGGAAMDLAPHAIDLMLHLAGPIRAVSARFCNLQFDYAVEDFCAALIEFVSGATGLLDVSYCSRWYGGRLEAFCSDGAYLVDGSLQPASVYRRCLRRQDADLPPKEELSNDCFRDSIADVSDAIRTGRSPTVTMDDGLEVMRVLDGIYASAREGCRVEIHRA